ncbi:MAG: GxxExxY protein [Lewinellaceae bacterium]|nr:GxxExxY protein [Saprospiraceae bacterium]MCB9339883.1 GxxExxY protein [Lewinellaceae bacterium]
MSKFLFEEETYSIIGICMEIHSILGPGLKEIVYKDAMEYEFNLQNIPYEREKKFEVHYKNIILPHNFYADFVAYDNIILEVKACNEIIDDHITQALNYISIAQSRLSLILNFGAQSFQKKRVIR